MNAHPQRRVHAARVAADCVVGKRASKSTNGCYQMDVIDDGGVLLINQFTIASLEKIKDDEEDGLTCSRTIHDKNDVLSSCL